MKREARARGCAKLTLEAHELNTGAIRLYERNGLESWDTWDTDEKGRTFFYSMKLKPASDVKDEATKDSKAIELSKAPAPQAADGAVLVEKTADGVGAAGGVESNTMPDATGTAVTTSAPRDDETQAAAPGEDEASVPSDDEFGDFGNGTSLLPANSTPVLATTDDDFGIYEQISTKMVF